MSIYNIFAIVIGSLLLFAAVNGFQRTTLFFTKRREQSVQHFRQYTFLNKKNKKQEGSIERPQNEFSRSVPSDKILKLHGKHQRNRAFNDAPQRQYSVDIEASPEECKALADRFQLSEIENLEASLSLGPEGSNGIESAKGIFVQGTAYAKVTQTCVRSNEKFQIKLEFPIYSILRPVDGIGPAFVVSSESDAPVQLNRDKISRNIGKNEYNEEDVDPTEMLKIQSMLEDIEQHEENCDDVLMEDENIYGSNGMLDVGELVAQLFWLQLDPYPKKPGTEFSTFSITG